MVRRRYSEAFKREAVALVASGQSVEAVAGQLGMPHGTLWNWVTADAARPTAGKPAGMTEAEWVDPTTYRTALKRIAELERENEFLGKASAYFAQKVQK